MIQVGANFGKVEVCPVCLDGRNDQQHLLECSILKLNTSVTQNESNSYIDIYEEDSTKVIKISEALHQLYKKREQILDKQ